MLTQLRSTSMKSYKIVKTLVELHTVDDRFHYAYS